MYGYSMGELNVLVTENGQGWTEIFSKSGNQGASWGYATRTYEGKGQVVRFRAKTGTSYTSDIAIDDVRLEPIQDTTGHVRPHACATSFPSLSREEMRPINLLIS